MYNENINNKDKYKALWKGEYVSVISPKKNKYEILHEGTNITTIPIIYIKNNYYIIIRKEYCPPYQIKDDTLNKLYYTLISGMCEKNENYKSALIREIEEESGIKILNYKIIQEKKYIPIYKSSDIRTYFSIIFITKFKVHKPKTDGTFGEKNSKSVFIKLNNIKKLLNIKNIDYLLYSALHILLYKLNK